MKKLIMPVIAIILVTGFSAFTILGETESKNTSNLYWYLFDEVNQEVGTQIGTGPIDIDTYGGSDHPGCVRNTNKDCARGYTQQQTTGTSQTMAESDGLHEN